MAAGGEVLASLGLPIAGLLSDEPLEIVVGKLEKLERLGRAILNAPADASTLPELLKEHVSSMFPRSQVEIRLDYDPPFPAQTLLHHPDAGAVPPSPAYCPPCNRWRRRLPRH